MLHVQLFHEHCSMLQTSQLQVPQLQALLAQQEAWGYCSAPGLLFLCDEFISTLLCSAGRRV